MGFPIFNNSTNKGVCKQATLPNYREGYLVAAVGTGSTPQELFVLNEGDMPFTEGAVSNLSCYDILLTVSYIVGGDCDNCTVDTHTIEDVNYTVPKNTEKYPLPEGGLISGVHFTALDAEGNPVDVTTEVKEFYRFVGEPSCNCNNITVPASIVAKPAAKEA